MTPYQATAVNNETIHNPMDRFSQSGILSGLLSVPRLIHEEFMSKQSFVSARPQPIPRQAHFHHVAPEPVVHRNERGYPPSASSFESLQSSGESDVSSQPRLLRLEQHSVKKLLKKSNKNNPRCEHGRIKYVCKDCKGGSICEHDRVRSVCKDCAGGSICGHGKIRGACKDCQLSPRCVHKKVRVRCPSCRPCIHDKDRSSCEACLLSQASRTAASLQLLLECRATKPLDDMPFRYLDPSSLEPF
jgi:hypothetical protein